MSLCVYKDARFARLFGASSAPGATRAVPKSTLALFALRDSLTVFASFNVPPLLAPLVGSPSLAQFVAPAAVQVFSTPLHLLGLDLFNRPTAVRGDADTGGGGEGGGGRKRRVGARDRWGRIRRDWAGAALARMGRVVPAFGVGGVVNAGVRRRLLGLVEG